MSKGILVVVVAFIVSCLLPGMAVAAVGDKLDEFVPSPGGNGRGVAIAGSASRTAYFSQYNTGNSDNLYSVDLGSHAAGPTLDTNMESIEPDRFFGALSWDAANGLLWAAEYSALAGRIDKITTSGVVSRIFNANDLEAGSTGVDGLAVDVDGTLWLSRDGLGIGSTPISH